MTEQRYSRREKETEAHVDAGSYIAEDDFCRAGAGFRREIFTREDPRVMPFSDSDIEAVNRVENERWFGK